MHHHPYAADAILRPPHPPPAPASSAAPTKAFLAARVCLLTPRADGKECNHAFAAPAMLVSLAVVVAEPGGITRSTTATLVHQPMYHSALRFGGPSHILGREALQCGGIASLATDTWLPTAAIERWARDAIDGVVWCATDSAAWQWSRSPGSLPSDIPLSQTAASALRVPTLVYHQSGLCFCPGALRWRVGASSDHKGFAARCNDALESPHAAYSKPVTSIVLVDFDDDAFSCPSFFGGRMYGTVSRLAQAQGLPHTCEGDEFRVCGSQCHSELVDAALQPATCWVAVNGAPSTAFANALGVSVDEFTAALSTMERAALTDARAMSRLVKAYCDPATLEDYAHCPNPMTRRLLSTPAMQDFAKRAFASPFNTDACRTKKSSEVATLPSDSADSNWIRQ